MHLSVWCEMFYPLSFSFWTANESFAQQLQHFLGSWCPRCIFAQSIKLSLVAMAYVIKKQNLFLSFSSWKLETSTWELENFCMDSHKQPEKKILNGILILSVIDFVYILVCVCLWCYSLSALLVECSAWYDPASNFLYYSLAISVLAFCTFYTHYGILYFKSYLYKLVVFII